MAVEERCVCTSGVFLPQGYEAVDKISVDIERRMVSSTKADTCTQKIHHVL